MKDTGGSDKELNERHIFKKGTEWRTHTKGTEVTEGSTAYISSIKTQRTKCL